MCRFADADRRELCATRKFRLQDESMASHILCHRLARCLRGYLCRKQVAVGHLARRIDAKMELCRVRQLTAAAHLVPGCHHTTPQISRHSPRASTQYSVMLP